MGLFWGVLGPSWGRLGALLELSWGPRGSPGGPLEAILDGIDQRRGGPICSPPSWALKMIPLGGRRSLSDKGRSRDADALHIRDTSSTASAYCAGSGPQAALPGSVGANCAAGSRLGGSRPRGAECLPSVGRAPHKALCVAGRLTGRPASRIPAVSWQGASQGAGRVAVRAITLPPPLHCDASRA